MGIIEKWSTIRDKRISLLDKITTLPSRTFSYEDVLYGKNDHSAFFVDGHVIPFKKQSTDSVKLSTGLFPCEQLILQICEKYNICKSRVCLSSKYGLSNDEYSSIIDKLHKDGLIEETSLDVRIANQSTIPVLKDILKDSGLPVSGKKADLIERIIESISINHIEELFPEVYFEITPTGKHIASKNRQILLSDRGLGENLTLWNITTVSGECDSDEECLSKVYDYLERRCDLHRKKSNYGLSRNCKLEQFNIAIQLGENEKALASLAELLLCDLNGIGNNYSKEYIHIYAQHWFPYSTSSFIVLPPAACEWLNTLKDALQLDNEQFAQSLKKSMATIDIPFHCFSIDECVDICMMEMSNDEDGLQGFYRSTEKRMHREHPEWFKDSDSTNVSAVDIVNELQSEYGNYTLEEIKADLASDGDADIEDEVGWVLQKALREIVNQCETTDEFWIKVQQELKLLF